LTIAASPSPERLEECGLLVANPPWRLESELLLLLPALAATLGRDGAGRFRLDWLVREK
jgi:23S rRNA (adenine2030-N6)-methyltransferase